MGLKDIVGRLVGRRLPKTGNPLLDSLLPTLVAGGGIGGLGALLGKFTGAGLGNKAHSWVGTGPNEPLDPDEVERALGADQVDKIARDAGMSRDDAKSGLAGIIPGLVDTMSPKGTLPTGNIAASLKNIDIADVLGT
jgi:uncharacterized protein YidB (DUF937 family)